LKDGYLPLEEKKGGNARRGKKVVQWKFTGRGGKMPGLISNGVKTMIGEGEGRSEKHLTRTWETGEAQRLLPVANHLGLGVGGGGGGGVGY